MRWKRSEDDEESDKVKQNHILENNDWEQAIQKKVLKLKVCIKLYTRFLHRLDFGEAISFLNLIIDFWSIMFIDNFYFYFLIFVVLLNRELTLE